MHHFLRCVAVLLVALTCGNCATVSAWSPCWDPCGGTTPVEGTKPVHVTVGETEAMDALITSVVEAQQRTQILINKYNNASHPKTRISDNMALFLRDIHFDNLPHQREDIHDVIEALQSDFNDVTAITVFVNNIHKNERHSENEVKFSYEMDDLESSLETVLCKVKIAAAAKGSNPSCIVGYDVMIPRLRDIEIDMYRYMRDFVVFTDAFSFLDGMASAFKSL